MFINLHLYFLRESPFLSHSFICTILRVHITVFLMSLTFLGCFWHMSLNSDRHLFHKEICQMGICLCMLYNG